MIYPCTQSMIDIHPEEKDAILAMEEKLQEIEESRTNLKEARKSMMYIHKGVSPDPYQIDDYKQE